MISKKPNITILVDNQACKGVVAEHGFSLWIETEGLNILFDTGQGAALVPNARALGVDLGNTRILVLSHGHSDHTGGMPQVLKRSRHLHLYCHPGIVSPRYAIRNGISRSIKIPKTAMAALDKLPSQNLHWVQQPTLLTHRTGLTGPIPRKTRFQESLGPFYLDPQGNRPDIIEDDMALWIRTDNGLVVCVGCCHAGLINTLNHVRDLNEGMRIRAVIGGFHLINAHHQDLDEMIPILKQIGPELLVPCHCTGKTATSALENAFGDRVSPGAAGMTYQF